MIKKLVGEVFDYFNSGWVGAYISFWTWAIEGIPEVICLS